MDKACVLVVDDKQNMLKLCREILGDEFEVETAGNGTAALEQLSRRSVDVVLTDFRMPSLDGTRLLGEIRERGLDPEVILMTGYGTIEGAVEAMRAGAFDYLAKPFDPQVLLAAVRRAVEHRSARRQAEQVRDRVESRFGMGAMVGTSPAMRQVFQAISAARSGAAPIVLCGETGTGRELVARLIHFGGTRNRARFVPIAATGFRPDRLRELLTGEAHVADGGTLFVEELLDLPEELRSALPDILSGRPAHRLAAATVADPAAAELAPLVSRAGARVISLPPLRARVEDIPLLAAHFVAKHAPRIAPAVERIDPDALAALAAHDWPGNVRALEAVIERALVVTRGDAIERHHIAPEILASSIGSQNATDPTSVSYRDALALARERTSQQYIAALLRLCDGNVTRAADLAGLERESLHRLMRRYNIRSEDFKPPLHRGEPDDDA